MRLGAPNRLHSGRRVIRGTESLPYGAPNGSNLIKSQNCLLPHSNKTAKYFSLCFSSLPFEEIIKTLPNLHQNHFRLFQNFTKLDLVPFFTTYLNQKPQIQRKIHSPSLETFSPRIFRFEIKFNLEIFRQN